MSDTRESAVMTSTDRPDPDATMTAEAIEQRPGAPSTQEPTHPNR